MNSKKHLSVKYYRGQACPLHVFLHFFNGELQKISLKKGETFALFFLSSTEFPSVIQWFANFLQGKQPPFPLPLTFHFPTFTKRVLKELQKIPMGKTLSYQELAKNVGNASASRAVGNACHRNPFPLVIPCHRVVQKNGQLGGFAYNPEVKKTLLDFEKRFKKRVQVPESASLEESPLEKSDELL